MEVYQSCSECKNPIEFICHNCNINTDKEIHSDCIAKKITITV